MVILFDNLWWPVLMKSLTKMNISKILWFFIDNYFRDRLTTISTPGKEFIKTLTKGSPGVTFCDVVFHPCLKIMMELNKVED